LSDSQPGAFLGELGKSVRASCKVTCVSLIECSCSVAHQSSTYCATKPAGANAEIPGPPNWGTRGPVEEFPAHLSQRAHGLNACDSRTFGLDFYGEGSVHAGVVGCVESIAPTAESASPQWRGFGWWVRRAWGAAAQPENHPMARSYPVDETKIADASE
jgi:hypothetical protein